MTCSLQHNRACCQVLGHDFLPVYLVSRRDRTSVAPEPIVERTPPPMKALRFYAPEDVRLEEVPEPACGPDEVKLRVAQLLDLRHRREDPPQRPPEPHSPAHDRPRDRRRGRRGGSRRERDVRQHVAGRRPRAGDRGGAVRRVLRVPEGLDGGVPEPDLGRLPVRRRVRRVHDRAAPGAPGRRPEPDPRQRRVRRGLRSRAVRLRDQRPGAARHRARRHRRRLRRRPDRVHAHPDRPWRARVRLGLPRRRQRRAAEDVGRGGPARRDDRRLRRSTSSSGSWS